MRKALILMALLAMMAVFAGCGESIDPGENKTVPDIHLIKKDGHFDWEDCQARELQDKVIMLESSYCGHCKATLPVFKEVAEQKGVNPLILDLSVEEERQKMDDMRINVQYTPTFIFGCDYYTGAKSREDYEGLFDSFIEFKEALP